MSKEALISKLLSIGFELAEPATETVNQLRLIGRITPGRKDTWKVAIELLCIEATLQSWSLDISKPHFVPKPLIDLVISGAEPANGTHLFFSWRIIFQGEGIAAHYESIATSLARVQQPRSELMEVPLSAPPNRNALKNGKGAVGVFQQKVGPMYRGDG